MQTPLFVQLIRHGLIPAHIGDVPLTQEGVRLAEMRARTLCAEFEPGDEVTILCDDESLRTRETAAIYYGCMWDELEKRDVLLRAPRAERALRDPDLFIAGQNIQLVDTPEAMAQLVTSTGLRASEIRDLPFFQDLWDEKDKDRFWLTAGDPPGENGAAVARRVFTFARSLTQLPRSRPGRYLCLTHSAVQRSVIAHLMLGEDPGEPEHLEAVDLLFEMGTVTLRWRDRVRTLSL